VDVATVRNVEELRTKVKELRAVDLAHCSSTDLDVFLGNHRDAANASLDPLATIASLNWAAESNGPLIVVAPPVFILCQLYIGKEDRDPRTFGVNVTAVHSVDALKDAVLAKVSIELAHCTAPFLKVYPAATPIPVPPGTTALHPLVEIFSLNLTGDDTLIVVAPPPPPPQVRNIPPLFLPH
jgi:hypothetical protein